MFPHAYRSRDGYCIPATARPRRDIDEALAAKYPYRAYLPVNRLEDGTMHDW